MAQIIIGFVAKGLTTPKIRVSGERQHTVAWISIAMPCWLS